jgi:hypothetical protein
MFNSTMFTTRPPDAAHGTMVKQATRMTAPAAQARVLHLKRKHQFQLWASMLTLTAAALFAMSANAQSLDSAAASRSAPALIQSSNPETPTIVTTPAVPSAPATPATRKYAAQDVERAFSFLDSNRDGKISRAEAAGFKNIAKHFDAADVNKDNFLSKEEFDNALNAP